jgi:hypothetical protein
MKSELLVAPENLEQFLLLTVYVVPVQGEKYILYQYLKLRHSFVYDLYIERWKEKERKKIKDRGNGGWQRVKPRTQKL